MTPWLYILMQIYIVCAVMFELPLMHKMSCLQLIVAESLITAVYSTYIDCFLDANWALTNVTDANNGNLALIHSSWGIKEPESSSPPEGPAQHAPLLCIK